MPLTRIDSAFLDLDAIGGIDFDVQSGVPTLSVDATTHRVGIGTDTPAYLAHIHNSGTGDGDHSYLHFTTGDTGATGSDGFSLGIGANQIAYINYREAGTLSLGTSGTQRLNITSGGDLQVKGGNLHLDSNAEFALFEDDTSGSYVNSAKIALDFSGNVARIRSSTNGSATIRPIALYTGNDARLYIATDGNVGIGTLTPTARLHVNGTALFGSTVQLGAWADTSDSAIYMVNQANSGQIVVKGDGTSTASAFSVYSGGWSGATDEVAAIKADGSVQFAGGNGVTTNQSFGIDQYGRVSIREDASTPADVFSIYKGSSSTKTVSISNNGTATFAGLVDIGTASSPAGDYGLIAYSSGDGASNKSAIFARNTNAAGRNYVGADNSGTTTFEVFGNGNVIANNLYSNKLISKTTANDSTTTIGARNALGNEVDVVTVTVGGNVGIGTDNPAQKLDVIGGNIRVGKTSNGQFIGENNSGAVKIKLDTDGVSHLSGGNVGIGESNPSRLLYVASSSSDAYSSTAGSNGALLRLINKDGTDNTGVNNQVGIELYVGTGATTVGMLTMVRTGNNVGDLTYKTRTGANSYAEHFRIQGAGRVGIGTDDAKFGQSTPISTYVPKLGVQGSIMIGNLSTTASDRHELQFYRRNGAAGQPIDTHDMGRIAWYGSNNDSDNASLAWSIGVTPDGGTWTSGANRKGFLAFNNHNGEQLRITSGGVVNIGDVTPNASGSGVFNAYSSTSGALSQFVHAAGNGGLRIGGTGPGSAANLVFSNDYNNNAWVDEYTIRLDGSNDSLNFLNGGTAAAAQVTFASNGNVGIGSAAPTTKLDVYGSIYANDGANIRTYRSGNVRYGSLYTSSEGTFLEGTSVGDNTYLRSPSNHIGLRTGTTDRFYVRNQGQVQVFGGRTSIANVATGNAALEVMGKSLDGSSTTVDLNISAADSTSGAHIQLFENGNNANQLSSLVFNHGSLKAMIASSRVATTNWGTDLRFYNHNDSTTAADQHKVYERMRIKSDGKVGIGTTNPGSRLDIVTVSTESGLRVSSSNSWGNIANPMVLFDGNTAGNGDGNILKVKTGASRSDVEIFSVENGNAEIFGVRGNATTWIGAYSNTSSDHMLDVASNRGSGGNSGIRCLYPGGGNLTNTEFAALGYRDSEWSAVYANQGSAGAAIYAVGNVGIGTNTPTDPLHIEGAGDFKLKLHSTGNNNVGLRLWSTKDWIVQSGPAAGNGLRFYDETAGGLGEALRIRTDGHVVSGVSLITSTSYSTVDSFYSTNEGCGMYRNGAYSSCGAHIEVGADATDGWANIYLNRFWSSGEDERMIDFRISNSVKGTITSNSSGTTYNTTSDIRLKTDIKPISDAIDKLMNMNPVTHKWKEDPDGDTVHGFIAQEMQNIAPEAVHGKPDGEMMMGMDYGRITPIIVAALQNAIEEINTLKQRILDLEN